MVSFGCAAYQRNFRTTRLHTKLICILPQTVRSRITDPYKCIQGTKKVSNKLWESTQIRPCAMFPLPTYALLSALCTRPLPLLQLWYDIAAQEFERTHSVRVWQSPRLCFQ